jgi:hypothetical protein
MLLVGGKGLQSQLRAIEFSWIKFVADMLRRIVVTEGVCLLSCCLVPRIVGFVGSLLILIIVEIVFFFVCGRNQKNFNDVII